MQRARRKLNHQRYRGVALLWVALVTIVMVLMAGLAIDTVYAVYGSQELQIAADGSSLAGALEVRRDIDDARDAAQSIAAANDVAETSVLLQQNEANNEHGDIVIGFYHVASETFTPRTSEPNAVKVNARRTAASENGELPLIIGQLIGVNSISVERPAISMIYGDVGPGIIVLNETASCAFDMRGTPALLNVMNGTIQINSSHEKAACNSGQPTLKTQDLYIHGGHESKFDDQVKYDGNIFTNADRVPDPLELLPEPNYASLRDLGGRRITANVEETARPGYYSEGFNLRNGSLTLSPGVYILGGAGLDVNGGNLYAEGVMFYIVDDGELDLRGNGEIKITPMETLSYPAGPSIPEAYANARVSIFQQRINQNAGRVLGTNQFDVSGTIYIKDAHLEIGGTSNSFANGLLVDTLEFHGSGEFNIDYDNRFPNIPRQVFIIE